MQNIIDNINHHLAFFADRFFTDPISVQITPFKEGKDGDKLSVNIKLFFKGATCSVKELSGGETARLELAICLAINSLGNGSMLLLDECFSSLDSVTTEDIVELLKTHAKETGKLIISVCHQASEGSFDSVINLGALARPITPGHFSCGVYLCSWVCCIMKQQSSILLYIQWCQFCHIIMLIF